MIVKIYKNPVIEDQVAAEWLRKLKPQYPELRAVRIERVLRAEKPSFSAQDIALLERLFCYPGAETVSEKSRLPTDFPIREISYRRAWTDPELESIRAAAEALGIPDLKWARLATRFQFEGLSDQQTQEITARNIFNPQVQSIISEGEEFDTLIPQGSTAEVVNFDVAAMNLKQLQEISNDRRWFMYDKQLLALKSFFAKEKRPARDAELELIATLWSDHCNHTTWKALGLLQAIGKSVEEISHPLVISALVDNSGVWDFYDGWAINVKGETHISPTFGGDPYGGILTKHGGVIRDIILTGQGAWPWAGTTIMAICDPRMPWTKLEVGAIHPRIVLNESIRGTRDYTNPMGIPMAWSQYLCDPRNVKGLALGHSIGILPVSRAKKGEPRAGDLIVLIGGPTGDDGVHGATVSSGKTTSETVSRDAAHVQIGMPIEEIKMKEAVPVLRDFDCIRACTDLGAGGIVAIVEMAKNLGFWVNLARLRFKSAALEYWKMVISESQERGILAVPPEKIGLALSILRRFGVPASVIGVFSDSGRCQYVYNPVLEDGSGNTDVFGNMGGIVVVDLPTEFLHEGCPLPEIEVREPMARSEQADISVPANPEEWNKVVQNHLGHFNICDQSVPAHHYDQTVQGNTVMPYISGERENMQDDIFVATPLRGKPYGVGLANAVNQMYTDVDPAIAGRLIYVQAIAKLIAAGFAPTDILCTANVYNPKVTDNPEAAWRLKELVLNGYLWAANKFKIPVISGKDSSSGTFVTRDGRRIDAPLTLNILASGKIPDASSVIPKAFPSPGEDIMLFTPGLVRPSLDGSVFLDAQRSGMRGSKLTELDYDEVYRGWSAYHRLSKDVGITSRSAVCEGGLIRRVFEMCVGSGLGCRLMFDSDLPLWLFSELSVGIIFTTSNPDYWVKNLGESCKYIGWVEGYPQIKVDQGREQQVWLNLEELGNLWSKTLTEVLQ